jgi:hypothetical protein
MMARLPCTLRQLLQGAGMLCALLLDATRFLRLCLHSPAALAAENLFLRQQLALYQDHHAKPRRATAATRFTLVWLSQWFDWPPMLTVVHPETFRRWQRQGSRLFWRWPSPPGRPPIPVELQALIRQMARDNCTWGQRRIANELLLKLGLQVSPCTVRKDMPTRLDRAPGHRVPSQRWSTFIRNHAGELIVSSMSTDLLTRGIQVLAQVKRFFHRWWGRSVASRGQESAPSHAMFLLLLTDARLVPAAGPPGPCEVISENDRSPPDIRPPYHPVPDTAARVIPMDALDVRPALDVGCGWNRARASSGSAEPLSPSAPQVILLRRAA